MSDSGTGEFSSLVYQCRVYWEYLGWCKLLHRSEGTNAPATHSALNACGYQLTYQSYHTSGCEPANRLPHVWLLPVGEVHVMRPDSSPVPPPEHRGVYHCQQKPPKNPRANGSVRSSRLSVSSRSFAVCRGCPSCRTADSWDR